MSLLKIFTGPARVRPLFSWKISTLKGFKSTVSSTEKASAPMKPEDLHRKSFTTRDTIEETISRYKSSDFKVIPDPAHIEHFKSRKDCTEDYIDSDRKNSPRPKFFSFKLSSGSPGSGRSPSEKRPAWKCEEAESLTPTHKEPEGMLDKIALSAARGLNQAANYIATQNKHVKSNEEVWITRISLMEALDPVPAAAATTVHHVKSILFSRFDQEWSRGFNDEWENEQMHLFTALELKKPSVFFRMGVLLMQGVFVPIYTALYIVSPRLCHRFTAYMNEQDVATYTECLQEMECGQLTCWRNEPAPCSAKAYWKLPADATIRDVILAIRADEAQHCSVNHIVATMKKGDRFPSRQRNPCQEDN